MLVQNNKIAHELERSFSNVFIYSVHSLLRFFWQSFIINESSELTDWNYFIKNSRFCCVMKKAKLHNHHWRRNYFVSFNVCLLIVKGTKWFYAQCCSLMGTVNANICDIMKSTFAYFTKFFISSNFTSEIFTFRHPTQHVKPPNT